MKKVTRKILSLLLSIAMVFGMVQGVGVLPAFAAGVPTSVTIGTTPLTDGRYYTVKTGMDPSYALVAEADTQPSAGTPYLYYHNGTLVVTGTVSLTSSGPSPLSINGGALTIAGSGALTLSGSGAPAVQMSASDTLILSGSINLATKQTGAAPAVNGGTMLTADSYSGNIAINAGTSNALLDMSTVSLKTSGSIDIFGGNGGVPVIGSSGGAVTLEGHTVSLANPANGMLISASSVSIAAANGSLFLTGNGNAPLLYADNITLSASENIFVQNSGGPAIYGNLTVTKAKNVTVTSGVLAVNGTADITATGDVTISATGNAPTAQGLNVTGAKNVSITGAGNAPTVTGNVNISVSGDVGIQNTGSNSVIWGDAVSISTSGGSITALAKENVPVINAHSGNVTLQASGNVLVQGETSDTASVITAANKTVTSANGIVIVSGSKGSTIAAGGKTVSAVYGGDASGGLNLNSTTPTRSTYYKAGNGYALFTPAQNGNPAVLALTNATIDTNYDEAITLPNAAVTMQLSGRNILRSNASNGSGIDGTGSLTITSSNAGTLDMESNSFAMSFEKAYGKTITIGGNASVTAVSHNRSAVIAGGNLTVEPDAKFAAKGMVFDVMIEGNFLAPNFNGSVLVDNQTATPKTFDFTVYGTCDIPGGLTSAPIGTLPSGVFSLHIPSGSQMTIPSGSSLMVTDMSKLKLEGKMVNNGIIYLPVGATVDQIKAMKLTGTGFVFVPESIDSNGMPSKDKGAAYTNDGVALKTVSGDLDLTTGDHSGATLEKDGYTWTKSGEGDSEVWTLTLNHTCIDGNLTLPDKTIIINTTADSIVSGGITLGSSNPGNLIFTGSGSLTVNGSISGGQGGSVTVAEKASVTVSSGISVSTSGGVNGALIVNGTLTASSGLPSAVISTGKAEIGPAGILNVTGTVGLKLNGMNSGSGTVYDNAFVMKRGGKLNANCTQATVTVFTNTDKATKENASKVIVLPDGYLPNGYEIAVVSGENGGSAQYAYAIAPKGAALMLESEQVTGAGGKLILEKPAPIVSGVTVSPATVSVKKGNSQVFSAAVVGTNNPSQNVTWTVSGNKSQSTTIDSNGKLTIATNETASTITVKATSTDDTAKFGTATVTMTGSAENSNTDNNGGSGTNPAQPVPAQPQAPTTDSNKNPQTGDDLNAALLLRFLVICIGGIAVALQAKYLKKGRRV